MLQVDDSTGFGGCRDQLGLHAQIGGYLQDVDDLGGRRCMFRVMNVGQHRQADLVLDPAQYSQALVQTGALEVVE